MKTFNLTDKLALREKIWRATGKDPGPVHPDHFLSATRGGIKADRPSPPAQKPGVFEVHFLPLHSDFAIRRIEFNLN